MTNDNYLIKARSKIETGKSRITRHIDCMSISISEETKKNKKERWHSDGLFFETLWHCTKINQ